MTTVLLSGILDRRMVVLFATLEALPGKIDALLEACRMVRPPSQNEPGCLFYDFYQNADHPENVIFFEEWESREILDAHFGEDHFHAFAESASELLVSPAKIRIYEVSSQESL